MRECMNGRRFAIVGYDGVDEADVCREERAAVRVQDTLVAVDDIFGLVVARASEGGTDADELQGLVDEMALRADRSETFLEADREFHTKLFSATGNRLAEQLVGAFWDVHTAVIPLLGIVMPDDVKQIAKAHGDMLSAAVAGDVEAYRRAVLAHYAPLQRSLSTATAASR